MMILPTRFRPYAKSPALLATTMLTGATLLGSAWAPTPAAAQQLPISPCFGAPFVSQPGIPAGGVAWGSTSPDGKDGKGAGFDGPGHAGDPGNPGATYNFEGGSGGNFSYVGIAAVAGAGGKGSNASAGKPFGSEGGGEGSLGGTGGTITFSIDSGASLNFSTPVTSPFPVAQAASCLYTAGGTGGESGTSEIDGPLHPGGNGGDGGSITATVDGVVTSLQLGLYVEANGGNGGNGADGSANPDLTTTGSDGGTGGTGGSVTVDVSGNVSTTGSGAGRAITALSIGGQGGTGGAGSGRIDGDGGQGGMGGQVQVTVESGGNVSTPTGTSNASAIWAVSMGGGGGNGGGGSTDGGNAGNGYTGGQVTVTVDGSVSTGSSDSPAIVAMSLGGTGGAAGEGGSWMGGGGGNGQNGGNGGNVTINGSGGSIVTGSASSPISNSDGVQAFSIGGGGGTGGDSDGWMSVGGDGGAGGGGGAIDIELSSDVTTFGDRSAGIFAQSVGGGGGNGGNATGGGFGVDMTVGGTGGGGGGAGTITVASGGTIQTDGGNSPGIALYSIGGGGGRGGAAYGSSVGAGLSMQVSVGGSGGNGGDGNSIGQNGSGDATNSGSILTSGTDSDGILAQSIGGGGGTGAPAMATAIAIGGEDLPALSVSAAIGGRGGYGGNGSTVTLANSGLISVAGAGSRGIAAQSIGGGGGRGGDASSTALAMSAGAPSLSANISAGGTGGNGGGGSTVTVDNSGLIVTAGESGDAILAQSIGGGGGISGSGDGSSTASGGDYSFGLTVNLGGGTNSDPADNGNGGGDGGAVTIGNDGGILTLGDGAAGISAQSIGGGGGTAGGAGGKASGSGSSLTATVNVGGRGGNAGDGNAVSVTNSGSILTYGADSNAIIAQSIGGGGGKGGKGASGLGGSNSTGDGGNAAGGDASTINPAASGSYAAGNGYGSTRGLLSLAHSLLGYGDNTDFSDDPASMDDLTATSEAGGGDADDGSNTSISLSVSVGGNAGGGGKGGEVSVENDGGQIATTGKMSDAILAQSVGGGGGKGGAASATAHSGTAQGAFSVGGTGGSGGDSGFVNVDSSDPSSSITTVGSHAAGIVAQSIGGGGGVGGKSGSSTGALQGLAVSIGGNGGSGGNAGGNSSTYDPSSGKLMAVEVKTGGTIQTASHDAIGVIAQAIGGGGGIVKSLATDQEATGGAATDSGDYQLDLTFGGASGISGSVLGVVSVSSSSGSILTAGNNAHGIVAQSIGGGGGLVLGGTPTGTDLFGTGARSGSADIVTVAVSSSIATVGDGAFGIVAQSIGGGGGFGGNTASSSSLVAFTGAGAAVGGGNGDTVTVDLTSASVNTTGENATAILAQSIGGGGGWITTDAGVVSGSAGGSASNITSSGGAVGIGVDAQSTVLATGDNSYGIFAESAGTDGAGQIEITVGESGQTTGSVGGDAAGIYMRGGSTSQTLSSANQVTNYGTISAGSGNSIIVDGGYAFVENSGTLDGSAQAVNGGGVQVDNTGTVNAVRSMTLGDSGRFNNDGLVTVGGVGKIGTVAIDGDFHQSAKGTLQFDADHVGKNADLLHLKSPSALAGTIAVNPLSLNRNELTVLVSDGLLTLDPSLSFTAAGNNHLFRYEGRSRDGSSIQVRATAHFLDDSAYLSEPHRRVAAYLQRAWDTDDEGRLSEGYLQLHRGVSDRASYAVALAGFAENAGTIVGALQPQASITFFDRMSDCPVIDPTLLFDERDCAWARTDTGSMDLSSGAGFSQSATALQAGAQREIADGWFLGGSVGVNWGSITADNGIVDADGTTFAAGAMLKRQFDERWLVAVSANAGFTSYDTTNQFSADGMTPTFGTASFDAAYGGLHSRVAYLQPMGGIFLKPYLDLHAVYGSTGGYTEAGFGAFAASVDGADGWRFAVAPALEASVPIALNQDTTLLAYASAGGLFFNDNSWSTSTRFLNAPDAAGSFEAETDLPDQLLQLKVGAQLFGSGAWDFKLEYAGEFGEDYSSNSGSLKINYKF